jgi:LPS sulfotransferase NodH
MTSDVSPRDGFPPHWRQLGARSLCSLDWQTESVDIPYVFLISGRCGSTHLASLLTESRACGQPSEYFNPDWMPNFPEARMANSLGEYIHYLVRARSSNRRFGFKIDHWRWEVLRSVVDVEQLFPVAKSVFFFMTRQDIVAQAHSFAVARATNIWHEYAGASSLKSQDYIPTDDEILWEMSLIAHAETGLSRYLERSGRPAMRLTYEQLMEDQEGLLWRVGKRLALEPGWLDKLAVVVPRVRRHEYTRREEQIEGLKRRLARELAFLDTCRHDFRYEEFNRLVLEMRGLDLRTWPAERYRREH